MDRISALVMLVSASMVDFTSNDRPPSLVFHRLPRTTEGVVPELEPIEGSCTVHPESSTASPARTNDFLTIFVVVFFPQYSRKGGLGKEKIPETIDGLALIH